MNSLMLFGTGQPGELQLCGQGGPKALSAAACQHDDDLRKFLSEMVAALTDDGTARLDIVGPSIAAGSEGEALQAALAAQTGQHVFLPSALLPDDKAASDAGTIDLVMQQYFYGDKLRAWADPYTQFERRAFVGKGAFGTAVLYRRRDDSSLVVLKEVDLHALTASERQLALNESQVLSILQHPNIISYYDSFEKDGTLV